MMKSKTITILKQFNIIYSCILIKCVKFASETNESDFRSQKSYTPFAKR